MSEDKGPARPRQVTMAVVIAVVGCLVLVVGLFDTLGRLRTPGTRSAVDEFLAESPGNTLGIDTAQVIDLMRALAFVSGALAAMGLVFAIYVMQRHRAARIGFTVVAALLVLTVPVAGMMPFFLAAAAFLLWSQPARDWYVGRVPVPAGAAGAGARPLLTQADPFGNGHADEPTGSPGQTPAHGQGPSPYGQVPQPSEQPSGQPYGQAPQPYGQVPPPYGQPYGQVPPPYGQPYGQVPQPSDGQPAYPAGAEAYPYLPQPRVAPGKRPLTVTIAAALTWLGAGLTALLMLLFMAVLALGGDAFVEEFDRAAQDSQVELTSDQALAVGWVVGVTMLVWSLISVVLAVFVMRRSNAARITLVVSAVMTALFSLVAIASIASVLTLLLAGATVILLFTGGANEWFSGRQEVRGQYPAPARTPPQPPRGNQPW